MRTVVAGDTIGGVPVTIEPAIEVGNIFKLGTRYSVPLGATYLDEKGNEQPIWMGSYGIGPARIVAAAVEQYADEHGISWPRSLAPFDVHLVALGKAGYARARGRRPRLRDARAAATSTSSTTTATSAPGEKFADAELLGCPLRLTVGRRSLESGEIEVQMRRGREQAPPLPLGAEPEALLRRPRRAVAEPPLEPPAARDSGPTPRRGRAGARRGSPSARLSGLDRSGPPPPQTEAGAPLNPWTIPNAIGFVRLALIPVFLVVALSSDDGQRRARRDAVRGDRLGRLRGRDRRARDAPVQPARRADGPRHRPPAGRLGRGRLLALRAAAALGARRCSRRARSLMLLLGRYALRRGVELRINWPGRLAVAPVMGGLFFPMTGLARLGEVLLYIGLALALVATALYARSGRRELAAGSSRLRLSFSDRREPE